MVRDYGGDLKVKRVECKKNRFWLVLKIEIIKCDFDDVTDGFEGDSYIGEWKNGKTDGFGVHTWINGMN